MDCALYFNKAVKKQNKQTKMEGRKESLCTVLNLSIIHFKQTKENGLFKVVKENLDKHYV